jgi:hypothetical protein
MPPPCPLSNHRTGEARRGTSGVRISTWPCGMAGCWPVRGARCWGLEAGGMGARRGRTNERRNGPAPTAGTGNRKRAGNPPHHHHHTHTPMHLLRYAIPALVPGALQVGRLGMGMWGEGAAPLLPGPCSGAGAVSAGGCWRLERRGCCCGCCCCALRIWDLAQSTKPGPAAGVLAPALVHVTYHQQQQRSTEPRHIPHTPHTTTTTTTPAAAARSPQPLRLRLSCCLLSRLSSPPPATATSTQHRGFQGAGSRHHHQQQLQRYIRLHQLERRFRTSPLASNPRGPASCLTKPTAFPEPQPQGQWPADWPPLTPQTTQNPKRAGGGGNGSC